MNIRSHLIGCIALLAGTTAFAASDAPRPEIRLTKNTGTYISTISDNGKWGVSTKEGSQDGNINPGGGIVIDLETMNQFDVPAPQDWAALYDITDDGNIAVGNCVGMPAYYDVAKEEWKEIVIPMKYQGGEFYSVTPDGRYAAGALLVTDVYKSYPMVCDLTTGKFIELKGLPKLDMQHIDSEQMKFSQISADGRYVLGTMSFSYIGPPQLFSFVYDLENHTYKVIGFKENDKRPWTPAADGLYYVDFPTMSSNGKWVTGQAYMVKEIAGQEYADEYVVAFRYDVANDKFELYDGPYDQDVAGFAITDDGVVLGATPAVNPYSEFMIRRGNYWYAMKRIFEQAYEMDFGKITNFNNTGKPSSVSADGRTLSLIASTSDSYILKMNESFTEASQRITLLGTPQVSPADGSSFSEISKVVLRFDREINLGKKAADVKLLEDGKVLANALNAIVDRTDVTLVFRTRALTPGVKYTVTIPDGFVTMLGDKTEGSPEFSFQYTGRADGSVKLVKAQPADGSTFAKFDAGENPLLLTFDAPVIPSEGKKVELYQGDETTPLAEFEVSAGGNLLLAYPLTTIYLYKDTDYTIVVPAGTVTDLSGNGPNDEIQLHYTGNYVRQVSSTDKYIFIDGCDNPNNYMLYDGDGNTPVESIRQWDFTPDTPWWVVRDTETSTDMAMASHSMYSPAGKSDDWMVTPQLFIPDASCYLQFQSQSYLRSKADRLKVYVYACETVYNTLNANIIKDFREKGVLVYDEIQEPGESTDYLEGDWKDNNISLAQFAGKAVYVAFVNDNENQSAIFVDNVRVLHDMKYSLNFTNGTSFVQTDEVNIKGILTVHSEMDTYKNLILTLRDAARQEIDKITASGLALKKDDTYNFEFTRPLTLPLGAETFFTVEVALDDVTSTVNGSVKNLHFLPEKNVVLEEFTGTRCPNCPLGILAIENLHKLYGDRFIPIGIHTYTGDAYNSGLENYSAYLNLVAAPSGVINRGEITNPMVSVQNDYRFSGAGLTDADTNREIELWLDKAVKEFNEPADGKIEFKVNYDAATGKLEIPGNATFAISYPNRNVNVFAVVLEDGLESFQYNNLMSISDPDLGEWGEGGKYAAATVYPYVHNHVARGVLSTYFSGTPGLIPTEIEAGKACEFVINADMPVTVSKAENTSVVLMLIDSDTGKYINAALARTNDPSGVGSITADASLSISVEAGVVTATADSAVIVTAFALDGSAAGSAYGADGYATVDLSSRKGVVIVKAAAASGCVVRKIVL